MFLLLPVSHEESLVQRLPWLTLGIILICVAVQVRSTMVEQESLQELGQLETRLGELEAELIGPTLQQVMHAPTVEAARTILRERASGTPTDDLAIEAESVFAFLRRALSEGTFRASATLLAEYRQLAREVADVQGRIPVYALGYVPAESGPLRMLSHAFAHGDWLHLLGNMWFLYLVGCSLEDRWGRVGFLMFYLLSAAVSALAFGKLHPDSHTPLVGASGAIAGAMGAFGVCFARSKVRIFYAYLMMIYPRWGTFQANALVLLLLWVIGQGLLTFLEASGSGVGIAYSAHAGGAVYGVLVGLSMRLSGTDQKLLAAQEEGYWDGGWKEDPRLLEAIALRERGMLERAATTLMELVRDNPDHQAAREELMAVALSDLEPVRASGRPGAGTQVDASPSNPKAARLRERTRLSALDKSIPWLLAHDRAQHNAAALRETYRGLRRRLPDYGLSDRELAWVVAAGLSLDDVLLSVDAASELLLFHPNSPALPQALWTVAELQGDSGRTALQRATLQQIVARFPGHQTAELARRTLASRPPPAGAS